MTTIVTLTTVWLTYAADPTDEQSFSLMSALTRDTSQPSRIQATAAGGRRLIRLTGYDRAWTIDLPHCTRDQLAWLELHVGDTMCARDDRGNKVFGVFSGLSVSEHQYNEEGDTSLPFAGITYTEAVV